MAARGIQKQDVEISLRHPGITLPVRQGVSHIIGYPKGSTGHGLHVAYFDLPDEILVKSVYWVAT
jgi:hypothetical protein